MASKDAEDRRANLVASRVHWSHMDLCEPTRDQETQGSSRKDSVTRWLTTTVTEEDAKHEPLWKASELLRRNTSSDDDLALGVEASLYGNPGVRTVQDFLRWSRSSPAVSRWNSLNSTASDHSGPLSVMDILNLWNDDPEEVLLEMGFGCDEPDLSGRIPARFINYQSQARGINLQVFLEAQKSRLDLENPDVSNRFRQLEVLQQVTTAFSSLVGSASPLSAPRGKDLLPEARERRKRMGMLFRRASKKSLSHVKSHTTKDLTASTTFLPCAAPDSHHPPSSLGDNRIPLKRIKTGLLETSNLSPLAEEQGVGPDAQLEPQEASMIVQDGALRSWPMREGRPLTANPFLQRKKSPGQARESFEMEEIHSFDESNVTGSFTGAAEHFVRCVARTNSCQSDSSGFLEEPFIPAHSQQESPAPDLIKALSCLSGGSTDSHSSERPGSPSPSSPLSSSSLLLCSSLKSPGVDKSLLSSSCPSLEQSLVIDHSPSPVSLCPQKSDNEVSETEATPDQDESQSASGPPSVHEYLPSCSLSLDLQNTSEIPPSPVSFTSLSPSTSLIEPASLMKVSEEIKTEEKNSPALHLSTLSYDPDGTAYSDFSCVPPPALPPPSTPNLDLAFSSISSSGGPGNTQSQQTHKNSPSASSGLSSLNPFSPELQINPKDPVFQDSGGKVLSDPPSFTQQKEETEMPYFLPSLLDQDSPLAPPAFILDSSSNGEEAPQPCLSPNHSIPDCQSALSSKLHDQERLINPTVGRISDFTVKPDQDRPCSNDDNTDIDSAFPVQEVFPAEIYHLPLDLQDTPQRNGKGEMEGERHFDTVQTQKTVYVSDSKSSGGLSEDSRLAYKEVCNQKENDQQVPSCSLYGELSNETKPEDSRKVCQTEISGTESVSPRCSLLICDEVPEAHIGDEVKPKGLFEIESLDVIFQTSVDGSEGENGDLDAFFQQLDTERQVYWAEPIQVSNTNPSLEESGSFESSDRSPETSLSTKGQDVLDSSSYTGRAMFLSLSSTAIDTVPATPDLKPLSRSVSVQMSSSPSSHIIHRKDVPYMTDSKRTFFPTVLPLDTSTPFRAVQSWTDLHIQRNNLSKIHGAPDMVQNEANVSTSSLETMQRPTMIFSSSPSLPLLSKDWQSYDSLHGMDRDCPTVSVSLDKGLWSDDEEEVDRNGNEDEKNLWEGNQTATMACCCSCDDHGNSCYNMQQTMGNIPYSLDELEEMVLCLQQFRSVLCNMEEQLSEDQASVYSALSDQDREKVRDIEELRQAVKKEAGELEMQLNELAHHYDDSLKMKMHRLLDEQSLLCTQLRVPLPGKVPTSLCPVPNRTVSTQCSLLHRMPSVDVQGDHVSSWNTWNENSPRQSPPGSDSICEGLNCSSTKVDKVDIVSFLQRLKETLRHSVNTDSLE